MQSNTDSMDTSGGMNHNQDLSKRQGLIAVNDLTYVLEPDLSVASNKTHKKHYFQSTLYEPGQQGICILNSGADYIDTRRSFLQFEVVNEGTSNLYFGRNGSALNLIKNITISTRSGDELCRIQDLNLLSNMILPLTYSEAWFKNQGQLIGYDGVVLGTDNVARGPTTYNQRFCIPMYLLCPLFSYGRLLPAMLMSGLRIEIQWEESATAYITMGHSNSGDTGPANPSNSTVQTYSIKNPYFSLASVQLSDSIQRALNELSATNGLEIVYTDYEKTPLQRNNDLGGNQNIEIRKSCSRALKAFARVRTQAGQSGNAQQPQVEHARDSLRSEELFPFMEYQWQLGSLYFPQQPVKGTTDSDVSGCAAEAYAYTLEACDKFHGSSDPPKLCFKEHDPSLKSPSAVALTAKGGIPGTATLVPGINWFSDRGSPGTYINGGHVVSVTLERSTMFNLAGVPVNNSRVLALRCKLINGTIDLRQDGANVATTVTKSLDVYLKYVKLARVFLNNVEVEQ